MHPNSYINHLFKHIVNRSIVCSIHIHARWYRTRKYIFGFDCETNSGAGFANVIIRAGDTFDTGDAPNNNIPERVYSYLFASYLYKYINMVYLLPHVVFVAMSWGHKQPAFLL